ncbi:hypothetical protein [Acidisoma silvae]|uniref:Uncharacterized protein n=1 Tax=Acidisoma silvae TaxID=2802396 RepID=A0A963YVR8_9PROT|nr:hypothetical protein [Acidisoma silvae]MCB8877811.1 hypothetical protein [Acidisoma silvae]
MWYKIGKMIQADPARSEPGDTPLDAETVHGLRAKVRHLEGIITGLETLIGQLKKNNDELRALKFGKDQNWESLGLSVRWQRLSRSHAQSHSLLL